MTNIPDLYPDDSVDPTSYCILLRIQELDEAWKRNVYRALNQWRENDRCPINVTDRVSLQTVCRRIDSLEEQGLLSKQPVYAEKVGQYVTGYDVTEKGRDTIARITASIIDNLVVTYLAQQVRDGRTDIEDGVFEKLSDNPFTSTDITPGFLQRRARQAIMQ